MEENVLILGATSDMAVAIARRLAGEGYSLTLAARDMDRLAALESDLRVRFMTSVNTVQFDALDFESHETFYVSLPERPDIVICVFGWLGDQQVAEHDWEHCHKIIDSNYTGAVSILNIVARDFSERRRGIIIGISSVAGERGRQSNYIYGSAKAAFTAYLSGLRNRMFSFGVHVMTVKPGFVKTRMLENMSTPRPLTAMPDEVAASLSKSIRRKRNIVYVRPVWSLVMGVIRTIPEPLFKRLKL